MSDWQTTTTRYPVSNGDILIRRVANGWTVTRFYDIPEQEVFEIGEYEEGGEDAAFCRMIRSTFDGDGVFQTKHEAGVVMLVRKHSRNYDNLEDKLEEIHELNEIQIDTAVERHRKAEETEDDG
ncbi:MAG: hypothetical protein HN929_05970 [Chloroflexi bacterium]|jgi:hypothetical protein|nr:hypothetical protein [Chloroflexota bacterium]